jgi:transposase
MPTNIDTSDVCCVALELSKTSWVCAFAAPDDGPGVVHKIKAGDVGRLLGIIGSSKAKAEHCLGRPLHVVLCYEIGYDGFWLARLLIARGIRTVVFDPASFLMLKA